MTIGIIPPYTNTGEAKYSKYLIMGFKKEGLEFELLDNSFFLRRPNIKIFLGSFYIKKNIDKKFSILHNLDNLGPFLLNGNKAKNILTVHDIAPVILPNIHSKIMNFNFKYILPKLIRNSDSIIASSRSTKKDLISKFNINSSKINVIPLGLDRSFFYPRNSNETILKKYGINDDYFLYVGGDNPRKNLKNLMFSFVEIHRRIPHKLVLIGPIKKNEVLKTIKNLNSHNSLEVLRKIIITGYVTEEDLPILYSSASALIFPTLYEGFGFPPLESMACGTPVIVSDNSSIREIVGNAGIFIRNPLNPNEIAEKIIKIVENDNLKFKLRKRGLKQVKKFSWDVTVRETIKLYEKLLVNK